MCSLKPPSESSLNSGVMPLYTLHTIFMFILYLNWSKWKYHQYSYKLRDILVITFLNMLWHLFWISKLWKPSVVPQMAGWGQTRQPCHACPLLPFAYTVGVVCVKTWSGVEEDDVRFYPWFPTRVFRRWQDFDELFAWRFGHVTFNSLGRPVPVAMF